MLSQQHSQDSRGGLCLRGAMDAACAAPLSCQVCQIATPTQSAGDNGSVLGVDWGKGVFEMLCGPSTALGLLDSSSRKVCSRLQRLHDQLALGCCLVSLDRAGQGRHHLFASRVPALLWCLSRAASCSCLHMWSSRCWPPQA